MSVRDASLTEPVARWASTWLNVPFIYGSTPDEVENYEGVDCADLLVAAHNKAHSEHRFDYTNADNLAKNDNLTQPGSEGTEGDLIFWDYHGPNEEGPPDGVYDHSMVCVGGTQAIWASAGWWSGYDPTEGNIKRCVIIDNYNDWKDFIAYSPFSPWRGTTPMPLWRRFR